jgi:hypothetical protein
MKRVQYAETVIDMGSPVSMTGPKANLLPLKPGRNAAPHLLPSPSLADSIGWQLRSCYGCCNHSIMQLPTVGR